MTRMLIRTDGSTMELLGPLSSDEIAQLINADGLGTVNLRHMGYPLHVMLLDDNGYDVEEVDHGVSDGVHHFERRPVRARKPVNVKATELYHLNCEPGTTHQIVGDVVIAPDDDFALHDDD